MKELSIINDDEIGKLVKAFNKMRESVRSRTEALKLQAHYDQSFSQAVTSCSSNYDLSQAISDALLSHSNWHPSPLSALYLFNEKTKELDCVVSHGTSDEAKKSMSSTSGLVGQAYNANEAMVVSADAVEGFYIDTGIGSIAPKAVILQPINYNNKVLGVLILAYTSTPTDRDLQYIENLTYQFGITIVAARRYEALQVLTEEAVEKSITDSLTGLRNRGFIQIELDRQISVSHRYNQDLALILIDIDH
ncbi:MAG: GAF domain-containing protein, partial [Magnetovibrio sp.]|nr:GAF domain-containing protein [Magnetovibrio sp.]